MSEFRLRRAEPADLDFLVDMVAAAVNWNSSRKPLTREEILRTPQIAHYVVGWPGSGEIGVVAVSGDDIAIGASWIRFLGAHDPGYGFVAEGVPEITLGVLEGHRRQGLGRALLRATLDLLRQAGVARVSLSVERDNYARDLYVSEGFLRLNAVGSADTMVLDLTS